MSFEEFQDGDHLGYLNGTILAILNLCVTVMLPIKFWLNPTFGLGEDVLKNFKMATIYRSGTILEILNLYVAPMPPIKFWLNLTYGFGGDITFEEFQDGRRQVLAQSDLRFGKRCRLKNFKMAAMDIGTEQS